ncbi:MAG: lysophospholipid acyltransferase family protein [Ilumatobacteraceae bacterium]
MIGVETFLAGNGRGSRVFYQFARFVVVSFCRIYLRMSVDGQENVPDTGAFVLAPIHRSYIDTPIASGCTRRRLRFMGKDSLWKKQPFRWTLSALGGFPVSRGTADREAILRSIQVLESGEPLVLFPEGERKSGPVVQPLFDGAAYVACKAGVPIVPVGIGGSELAMGKGAKWIRPRKVHVIIGRPLPVPSRVDGRMPRAAVRETSLLLHSELQRLFDAAERRASRQS